jgi:hypothetical protein
MRRSVETDFPDINMDKLRITEGVIYPHTYVCTYEGVFDKRLHFSLDSAVPTE